MNNGDQRTWKDGNVLKRTSPWVCLSCKTSTFKYIAGKLHCSKCYTAIVDPYN